MVTAHDNPRYVKDGVTVKWETFAAPPQLANETGSGVRLTLECSEYTSQLGNKEAVILALTEMVMGDPS